MQALLSEQHRPPKRICLAPRWDNQSTSHERARGFEICKIWHHCIISDPSTSKYSARCSRTSYGSRFWPHWPTCKYKICPSCNLRGECFTLSLFLSESTGSIIDVSLLHFWSSSGLHPRIESQFERQSKSKENWIILLTNLFKHNIKLGTTKKWSRFEATWKYLDTTGFWSAMSSKSVCFVEKSRRLDRKVLHSLVLENSVVIPSPFSGCTLPFVGFAFLNYVQQHERWFATIESRQKILSFSATHLHHLLG